MSTTTKHKPIRLLEVAVSTCEDAIAYLESDDKQGALEQLDDAAWLIERARNAIREHKPQDPA